KTYALYLSLHGAGVNAWRQASAYRQKRDAFVVAPTNRRRYGFDWQDWGRLDALEALEYVLAHYPIDPSRVYLTGHSMGGHGAWYLGTLYPSRFAAIAPSAGWPSFFTYAGGMPREFGSDPDLAPFTWTHLENDTLALVRNLTHTPIYILHGEKDDNVPVGQAKLAMAELRKFHRHYVYHEQPSAGHWWGDECVDWIPLFEFCRRHVRPEAPLRFRFTTFNPAVTASYAWARIDRQIRPARPSTIEVAVDPRKRTVTVRTENVAHLTLDLRGVLPPGAAKVVVDDRQVPFAGRHVSVPLHPVDTSGHAPKSPDCAGPLKLAFDGMMVWVYGTKGTPEENAAILAKVRYDSQVWWYRANGSPFWIGTDREFEQSWQSPPPSGNVILYGNADTNSAYRKLLPDCPVEIRRGAVRVGARTYEGDLGLLLVYPRPGTRNSLVGVVGATTAEMTRASQQARYFISGSACPDWVVYSDDTLLEGMAGVAASGYFGNAWELSDPRDD
ncbi:MAG: carboxylesterase family protein, partial [Planctomycetota bacterium]